jgi:heme-degrading monooxygenase HmoA
MMAGAIVKAALGQTPRKGPVELHLDFTIEPGKEKQLLENFRKIFRPAASKQPGYISVQLLRVRTVIQGPAAPQGVNYRFVLKYETEELRQQWVKRPIHQEVWPTLESQFASKDYTIRLFDTTDT